MRLQAYLRAVQHLPVTTVARLTKGEPFLVLSPHPDDETLGAGGLISMAINIGLHVEVMVLTDGAGSHPSSSTYPKERLIELRRKEVADAAAILRLPIEHIHHLNLVDTQAPRSGPAFDGAVRSIAKLVNDIKARTVFVTWEMDAHCDHVAASAMAKAVRESCANLRLWAYPIWGWHLNPDAGIRLRSPRGVRLDILGHIALKRSAIAAHRSQTTDLIADDPEGFRFTEQMLAPFLSRYEHFIEVMP